MINTIILGHALNELPKLPAESVNCVVTSPPFWGLRDYGIEPVTWDGDKNCKHIWGNELNPAGYRSNDNNPGKLQSIATQNRNDRQKSNFCQKCGAFKGSLGLEPTFELYIKHLCDIFDEVKRVLRKDGTCWVNLGDSYGGSGNASGHTKDTKNLGYKTSEMGATQGNQKATKQYAKSLCLIPQRFAIEMVNRGWILRNTIIWHKSNCMPSSAKDRFTVDFEYVYFFVKSKKYWFEQQFQPIAKATVKRSKNKFYPDNPKTKLWYSTQKAIKPGRDAQTFNQEVYKKIASGEKTTANMRCVWTIPTHPFPEAHFAVYPEELIEIPIKAGCPEFSCKKCGKARVKIYKPTGKYEICGGKDSITAKKIHKVSPTSTLLTGKRRVMKEVGYTDCGCNAGFEGGIVLDPFMGAGTTALVALKQRKRYIGIEIKKEYIDMANKRIANVQQEIF